MASKRLHYICSSHWDREWYLHFQDYRHKLVRLLDFVLDALEDGRLPGPFTCDGQSIILDDYLEIRPEARGRVDALLRQGKLVAGPWLVLPDEFLVAGESLVRNLRMGRERVRASGAEPSNAGFACDLFGHVSQLPQILAGFGIRGVLVWRGANGMQALRRWRGADGTTLFAYRFGRVGYCTFPDEARRAKDHLWDFDADEFAESLAAHVATEEARTDGPDILLFDGADHLIPEEGVWRGLERFVRENPGYQLEFASLDGYLAAAEASAPGALPLLEGELREPGKPHNDVDCTWLIPGVLSSRPWIKQENAACEALLLRWAEPFNAAAAALLGAPDQSPFIERAWRWLLENHPHDSICGCSVDAVHEDMKFRFAQCRRLGEVAAHESLLAIAAAAAGPADEDSVPVVLFNAAQEAFDGVAEFEVPVPRDWPAFNEFFGFEPKPAFRLLDAAGNELECQRLAQRMDAPRRVLHESRFARTDRVHWVRVAARVPVPACGWTALRARRVEAKSAELFTRARLAPTIARGGAALENEFLRLEPAAAAGPARLLDKRTGAEYPLPILQSCADIGDGWYHGQAVADDAFDSRACGAQCSVPADGPVLGRLRVRVPMMLPEEFDFASMRRSPRLREQPVEVLFTLADGADFLDVEVSLDHQVKDHRLRLLLPTGAAAAQSFLADSAFDVVERPIALPEEGHRWKELPVREQPMESWAAVGDGRRGLAIVAPGMKEAAVLDDADRTLALTLLRATRRTVFTDGEPEGQVQGPLSFRFRLVPLAAAPDPVALFVHAQRVAAGIRAVTPNPVEDRAARRYHGKAVPASFFSVDGPVVATSLRRTPDGGAEARVFNPSPDPVQARIATALATAMRETDFEGNPAGEPFDLTGTGGMLACSSKHIATLRTIP